MKAFKLLPKYLWQYKAVIAAFAIFAAVFAAVTYLYRMPVEAVLYTTLLCMIIALIFTGIHFYIYCKRANERERIIKFASEIVLPPAHSPAERDWLQAIEILRERNRDDLRKRTAERAEYIDYYTLWIHQIKTPIAAMGLILQEEDNEKNRALSQELFRIEQYAEMALWYLRMDGIDDLVLRKCNLNDIIKNSVRKYAPLFIRKKIKLNYSTADITVLTDEKWLAFIIEQLLSNAIKYTESGSVTISVENNILTIRDTGIGIAEEDLPRIFDKGYTGFNGRTERKSTGIGLYLCRKAADKLSHKLRVKSEVGKGSAFELDLNVYPLKSD